MRTIDLALKDVRQVLRDRKSLLFLLVMPIVFTFFFGFVFAKPNSTADTRLVIALVNHDENGMLSKALIDLFAASDTVRPVVIGEADAVQMDSKILQGEYAAGLVIPQGFSQGTLEGSGPSLENIINEETDGGQTVRRALQTTLTRVVGMAETARLSAKAFETANGPFASPAARQAYLDEAVRRAAEGWKNAPLVLKAYPAVPITADKDAMAGNPYNQFSPGMMIMFGIFGLFSAAMVMVIERKNGAMARLLTTPMNKAELIGGHILGMFIIFFAQQLILVIFGQLVLKVNYLREPVAVLLVMASFSLWVASLGLLIATLVKKEDQVVLASMIAMFIFSALGGSWFSLEMVGQTFSTIGHLTPTAWAIDGFQNIIARGLGLHAVLLPVGIVLAYAAAFFGIAIWKFKYE